jgi:hypothetical protein
MGVSAMVSSPERKHCCQNALQERVLELAHTALLDDATHKLAVVLIHRRQIMLDADGMIERGLGCHPAGMLRIGRSC